MTYITTRVKCMHIRYLCSICIYYIDTPIQVYTHNSVLNLRCAYNNNVVIAVVLLAARVSRARVRKPLKVESNLCVAHERGNVTLPVLPHAAWSRTIPLCRCSPTYILLYYIHDDLIVSYTIYIYTWNIYILYIRRTYIHIYDFRRGN